MALLFVLVLLAVANIARAFSAKGIDLWAGSVKSMGVNVLNGPAQVYD